MKFTASLAFTTALVFATGCPKSEEPQPAFPPAPAVDRYWAEGELPPSSREGVPTAGGALTVRIGSDPPTLNQITNDDLWCDRLVVGPLQESLVRIDEKDGPRYRAVPALAESWDVSPDGRTYTFKLRHGVKFHDGVPFTAQDVIATFDRLMDERVHAMSMRVFFTELDKSVDGKGYKALDDYTVRFTYRRPYYLTLQTLTDLPIQPKHLIQIEGTTGAGSTDSLLKLQPKEAARFSVGSPVWVTLSKKGPPENRNVAAVDGDSLKLDHALPSKPPPGTRVEVDYNNDPKMLREPVGTGPWRFVRWDPNKEIEFARNEDYWGPKPHFDRLIFRVVSNHTVATQLFERGELDVMTDIQPTVWVDMEKTPRWVNDYYRVRYFWNNYSWIGWNERRAFFKDRQVRQAMTYLFDRTTFYANALKNLEKPTTCPFFYASPGCDPALQPYPYDPAKGAALLDAAGWVDHDGDGVRDKDGIPFRFTFMMTEGSVMLAKLTPVLKEALHRAGVEMDIAKVEWAVYSDRLRDGDFDACSLIWGDKVPEMDPRQIWHSSQVNGGSNYVAFRNPEVDSLIDGISGELNDEKRYALMRRMHRILYDEQPYTWLTVRPRLEAISKRVKGLVPTIGFYDFNDGWIDATWQPMNARGGAKPPLSP